MKKILIAILFLGCLFKGYAQQPEQQKQKSQNPKGQGKGQSKGGQKGAEEKANKVVARLDSALALDPGQEEKIKSLVRQKTIEIKAIKDKYQAAAGDKNENKKAAKEEIKPIKKKFQDELRAVLTPEQQTKYDAYVKNRKEQKKNKKSEAGGEEELEE